MTGPRRYRWTGVLLALLWASDGSGAPGAPCEAQPAAHSHALSTSAAAQLRERVAQYEGLSDAQLHVAMEHMPPDRWIAVSPPTQRGPVAVLVLGHGYGPVGDCELARALERVSTRAPVAAALGMAMTSGDHIAAAVAWLEEQGAESIVAVPVVSGQSLSLVRQWEHALGLRPAGAYADLPRLDHAATVRWTSPLIAAPAFQEIVMNAARRVSLDPTHEELVLVSHGPEAASDDRRDSAVLGQHAKATAAVLGMAGGHVALLADDAPAIDRADAVGHLRETVQAVIQRGRTAVVIAVPVTTATSWVDKLRRDLHGLDYRLAADGLVNDPAFPTWIDSLLSP